MIDKVVEGVKRRIKDTQDYKLVHKYVRILPFDNDIAASAQKLIGLLSRAHNPQNQVLDVLFFPSLESEQRIVEYIAFPPISNFKSFSHLKEARFEILLCMFIVSNDALSSAILDAFYRGVKVR